MTEAVLSELKEGVATITLNRPERLNAINPALLAGLTAALRAADADTAVRAIVLRGAGRAFCAGDDLKEFDEQGRSSADARSYVE
ncbi:MAG TPA: enoyl-CoA hydratase/isomerase family protein, partial [Alphaproteobacteria bacterium]|nr:enoyl-CoA hydratase/isomerase family protein [Alphaproteobacteria bacterium]